MTRPIMNFLMDADESSELEEPDLKDDSDFSNLAKYVRRNDRHPQRRAGKLFTAAAVAEPVKFNFRLTKKSTKSTQPAPSDPVFAHPDAVPKRYSVNLGRRLLLSEFTGAAAGSPVVPLEQTINYNFDKEPPQCHSTPYHGPTIGQQRYTAPLTNPTQPPAAPGSIAASTTAAQDKPTVPSNISININVHSPLKKNPDQQSAHASRPSTSRRASIAPAAASQHQSMSNRSTPNELAESDRSVLALPLPSSQQTPSKTTRNHSTQQPDTPRPARSSSGNRTLTGSQTPVDPGRNTLPVTPKSQRSKEEFLRVLRMKSLTKSKALVDSPTLSAGITAAPIQTPTPAIPPPPAFASPAAVQQRITPPSMESEPLPVSSQPAVQEAEPARRTEYDMQAYLRNAKDGDILQDYSPRTSKTLLANMMNRERSTWLESLSVRPPSRISRPSRMPQPDGAVLDMQHLEKTIQSGSQQLRRNRLYTKGDSLNESSSGSQPKAADAAAPRRKRRSGEMLATMAEDNAHADGGATKLRRVSAKAPKGQQRVTSNSQMVDDSMMTSDEEESAAPQANVVQNVAVPVAPPARRAHSTSSESSECDFLDTIHEMSQRRLIVDDGIAERASRSREKSVVQGPRAKRSHNISQHYSPPSNDEAAGQTTKKTTRSRIPQPSKQQLPKVAPAGNKRGTFTIAAAEQAGHSSDDDTPQPVDRRGTYTKQAADRRGTYTKQAADRRGTYTKQAADRRGTYTKQAADNDSSYGQQTVDRRGTYTKQQEAGPVSDNEASDEDMYVPETQDEPIQSQRSRRTVTTAEVAARDELESEDEERSPHKATQLLSRSSRRAQATPDESEQSDGEAPDTIQGSTSKKLANRSQRGADNSTNILSKSARRAQTELLQEEESDGDERTLMQRTKSKKTTTANQSRNERSRQRDVTDDSLTEDEVQPQRSSTKVSSKSGHPAQTEQNNEDSDGEQSQQIRATTAKKTNRKSAQVTAKGSRHNNESGTEYESAFEDDVQQQRNVGKISSKSAHRAPANMTEEESDNDDIEPSQATTSNKSAEVSRTNKSKPAKVSQDDEQPRRHPANVPQKSVHHAQENLTEEESDGVDMEPTQQTTSKKTKHKPAQESHDDVQQQRNVAKFSSKSARRRQTTVEEAESDVVDMEPTQQTTSKKTKHKPAQESDDHVQQQRNVAKFTSKSARRPQTPLEEAESDDDERNPIQSTGSKNTAKRKPYQESDDDVQQERNVRKVSSKSAHGAPANMTEEESDNDDIQQPQATTSKKTAAVSEASRKTKRKTAQESDDDVQQQRNVAKVSSKSARRPQATVEESESDDGDVEPIQSTVSKRTAVVSEASRNKKRKQAQVSEDDEQHQHAENLKQDQSDDDEHETVQTTISKKAAIQAEASRAKKHKPSKSAPCAQPNMEEEESDEGEPEPVKSTASKKTAVVSAASHKTKRKPAQVSDDEGQEQPLHMSANLSRSNRIADESDGSASEHSAGNDDLSDTDADEPMPETIKVPTRTSKKTAPAIDSPKDRKTRKPAQVSKKRNLHHKENRPDEVEHAQADMSEEESDSGAPQEPINTLEVSMKTTTESNRKPVKVAAKRKRRIEEIQPESEPDDEEVVTINAKQSERVQAKNIPEKVSIKPGRRARAKSSDAEEVPESFQPVVSLGRRIRAEWTDDESGAQEHPKSVQSVAKPSKTPKQVVKKPNEKPSSRKIEIPTTVKRARNNLTTYKSINMSVDDDDSQHSDATTPPVTPQRTVYNMEEELNETIPETQAERVSSFVDEATDTDANIQVRMDSDTESIPTARLNNSSDSEGNDDRAAGFASDRNETFQSCSTAASRRSFTVCESVVSLVEQTKTTVVRSVRSANSPQPSTSAAAAAAEAAAAPAATKKKTTRRPYRKKKVPPTMNSFDYHPFDRERPVEDDPNVRRSKREPVARIKWWLSERQPLSPILVPHYYTDESKRSRRTGRPGRRKEAENSTATADNATTTSSSTVQNSTTDGLLMEMLNGKFESANRTWGCSGNASNVEIANKDHLDYQQMDGVEYWNYPSMGSHSRGYMKFNPNTRKKWCRTKEGLEIIVMSGTLSVRMDDLGEKNFSPGDLITMHSGVRYKMRNRNDSNVLAYFCKRFTPETSTMTE